MGASNGEQTGMLTGQAHLSKTHAQSIQSRKCGCQRPSSYALGSSAPLGTLQVVHQLGSSGVAEEQLAAALHLLQQKVVAALAGK